MHTCVFFIECMLNTSKWETIAAKLLYCCKSLFLYCEKLFAKDIYITNIRFKSILEPYKCQIAKIFWGFDPNSIGALQSRCPSPPAPKLRNFQCVPNDRNWKFLAHTPIFVTNHFLSKVHFLKDY